MVVRSGRTACTMTIFDSFVEEPYVFLAINRGGVKGNSIKASESRMGVFKLRSSGSSINDMESRTSTATLHTHPEDYPNWANLVGQGICKDGCTYEITSVTGGKNFATGVMEHLTFTLQRAKYSYDCDCKS